jgi:hypothetical protein
LSAHRKLKGRRAAEMTDFEIITIVITIFSLLIASMTLLLKLLAFLMVLHGKLGNK